MEYIIYIYIYKLIIFIIQFCKFMLNEYWYVISYDVDKLNDNNIIMKLHLIFTCEDKKKEVK